MRSTLLRTEPRNVRLNEHAISVARGRQNATVPGCRTTYVPIAFRMVGPARICMFSLVPLIASRNDLNFDGAPFLLIVKDQDLEDLRKR